MGNTETIEERVDKSRDKIGDGIEDLKTNKRELEREEKKLTSELVKIPRTKGTHILAKAKLIAANQIMQTQIDQNILDLQAMDQKLSHLNMHATSVQSMDEYNKILDDLNQDIDTKSVKKLHRQFQRNMNTLSSNQENISNTLTQGLEGFDENTNELVQKILDMHKIKIEAESPQVPQTDLLGQAPTQETRVAIPTVSLIDAQPLQPTYQDRLDKLKQ